jgi:hypothetical protein
MSTWEIVKGMVKMQEMGQDWKDGRGLVVARWIRSKPVENVDKPGDK